MQIINNSDDSLKYLQRSKDDLEREANDMQEEMQKLREQVSVLTATASHSMKKDDYQNLTVDNERLVTALSETRAAMLSYKNMCMVIADQAKNLKLI